MTVGQAMTREPATLAPEDPLMRAVELMRARAIRRIPIVAGGRLLGILAHGDLNRAQPSALSASQEEFDRVMETIPVSRIMITNPVTVAEETSLLEAAHTLHSTKFGGLPVLRDGKLVGILTDTDVIGALVQLLRQSG
jgi:acetoin utilization protein AcuB